MKEKKAVQYYLISLRLFYCEDVEIRIETLDEGNRTYFYFFFIILPIPP